MINKFKIKKCTKCGAIIKVIEDCRCNNCGFKCCGENMEEIIPNSVDAAKEKHIPTYVINDDKIIVNVNHVMDEEHYIEWIAIISNNEEYVKYFNPQEVASVEFKYIPGSKLYSYCNKHGLWVEEVK